MVADLIAGAWAGAIVRVEGGAVGLTFTGEGSCGVGALWRILPAGPDET